MVRSVCVLDRAPGALWSERTTHAQHPATYLLYILCILWLLVYKSVTVSTAHISTSDRITDQYETGGAAEKSCTASP